MTVEGLVKLQPTTALECHANLVVTFDDAALQKFRKQRGYTAEYVSLLSVC
jgi:hypothetical protein